jgi:hypothetical protein
MMNSITSVFDFSESNRLTIGQDSNNNNNYDNKNHTNTSETNRSPPSPGPYDLPESMAVAPIPCTLNNINLVTAAGPLKKRTAPVKHKAPAASAQSSSRPKKPRRAIPENKEFIPENEEPTEADVVGGRGGRSNHHAGNRPYWIKILGSRHYYRTCQSDAAKTMIAQGILSYIKDEKGGRFLNLDSKTNRWFILPDVVVLDKIKQALRDKYVPFWAKNMDIPIIPPGSFKENGQDTSGSGSSGNNNDRLSFPLLSNPDDGNKLGFLLSASRAAATSNSFTAAIPTMDDALKCKIDTLASFRRMTPTAAAVDNRMSFAFPPVGTAAPSFGLGMFHSLQNANLLSSMASLGGGGGLGAASLGAFTGAGVSHGFGIGGNSGAPSLSSLPPASYVSAAAAGGLFNSSGLQSSDVERIWKDSILSGDAKSVDLLHSLTGGGFASIGSLGATSFGFLDSMGPTAAVAPTYGNGGKDSSSSPKPPGNSGTTQNKKTDWIAMFKSLKKEEV